MSIRGDNLPPDLVSLVIVNELLTAAVRHLKTIDIPDEVFADMQNDMSKPSEPTWQLIKKPGGGVILHLVLSNAIDMDRASAGAPPAIGPNGEINF